ncbi:MAG: PIG-L family deacetylase [Acidimicrobiaceae bacterium]|nr:PIG-L family deacetylase [Acidimicrobiaceae bacterium]
MTNLATYLKDQRTGTTTDLDRPDVALAVGAHPDDIEFGCGATLARWATAGTEIHYVVCTDGSKGSWEPNRDQKELAATRERESEEAAMVISKSAQVTFLRNVDGNLEPDLDNRSRLAKVIRATRPDVILGHDPWKRYRIHPDHRNAGWLTTDAIVAARDPLFFPEHKLAVHRPKALLLWEADEPDHIEEISEYLQKKATALLKHVSQYETTMGLKNGKVSESEAAMLFSKISMAAEMVGKRWGRAGLYEEFKLIEEL